MEGGASRVLLITNRTGRRWLVPKGLVEEGLTPVESAQKEAFEEAGVRGQVDPRPLGVYEYAKWGGRCRVVTYLLEVREVLPEWPESEWRRRRWVSVAEATEIIDTRIPRTLMASLASRIQALEADS
jgi:8-oxo-dGTP pyrophosphatase MutT (NUDIX family)